MKTPMKTRNIDLAEARVGILITGRAPRDAGLLKRAEHSLGLFCRFFEDPVVAWSFTGESGDERPTLDLPIKYCELHGVEADSIIDANRNNGFKQMAQLARGYKFFSDKNIQLLFRTRLDVVVNPEVLYRAFCSFMGGGYGIWVTGGAAQAPNHLFDHLFMIRPAQAHVPAVDAFDTLKPILVELNKLGVSLAIGSHGWQFNSLVEDDDLAASVLLIELVLILIKRGWTPDERFLKGFIPFWLYTTTEFYEKQSLLASDASAHEFFPSLVGNKLSPACVMNERVVDFHKPINPLKLQFFRSNLELSKILNLLHRQGAPDPRRAVAGFLDSGLPLALRDVPVADAFGRLLAFVKASRV
jgi:hypothetical protein